MYHTLPSQVQNVHAGLQSIGHSAPCNNASCTSACLTRAMSKPKDKLRAAATSPLALRPKHTFRGPRLMEGSVILHACAQQESSTDGFGSARTVSDVDCAPISQAIAAQASRSPGCTSPSHFNQHVPSAQEQVLLGHLGRLDCLRGQLHPRQL